MAIAANAQSTPSHDDLVDSIFDDISKLQDEKAKAPVKTAPRRTKLTPTKLTANEQHFSKVFGVKPVSLLDHAVPVFTPDDWPEEVRGFIPQPDPGYVFRPDILEMAVWSLVNNDRPISMGPTGSGKSSLWQEIAARLGMPFFRLQLFDQMEDTALFGTVKIGDTGAMTFDEGPLPMFARHGGVLCLDEFYRGPVQVVMALQEALEDNGVVRMPTYVGEFAGRVVKPASWFRLVATDNTEGLGDMDGHHVSGHRHDTATIDRFGTAIRVEYPERAKEQEILVKRVPKLNTDVAARMLDVASLVRQAYKKGEIDLTVSPRTLIAWARKALYFGDEQVAFAYTYLNKLPDEDRPLIEKLVAKVYGSDA